MADKLGKPASRVRLYISGSSALASSVVSASSIVGNSSGASSIISSDGGPGGSSSGSLSSMTLVEGGSLALRSFYSSYVMVVKVSWLEPSAKFVWDTLEL